LSAYSQELPLLYSELVSGTPQHAQERLWLLRLLHAGLRVGLESPFSKENFSKD